MALKEPLIAELKYEATSTKKMLEKITTDVLSWKPHEKSMTLGRLASHIAELPVWINRTIATDEFDFSTFKFETFNPANTAELLQVFEEKQHQAISILETVTDEVLNSSYTMRRGDFILFTLPRKVVIRNFTYNHIVHHRGQLSVYLRLLDIPVPGMYGPSADEK